MQDDIRLAAGRAGNFDVEPTHLRSPALPQRFHDGFLSCKTAGIALEAASLFSFTIGNFILSINPVAKSSTDARVFQGGANPFHFDQVNANADDHEVQA
jgi:hypothetical protein